MTEQRKRRPTLKDIAERVGVTKMTVSRYLRDPSTVAAATREKIALAVDEMGYVPSRAPDILSNSTSKAIGILIPSLSNQVFAALAQGIESVTRPAGYQTLIAHYGYSQEEEEKKVASLLSYHVDGLILTEGRHSPQTLKMIKAAGIPVVETMDIPQEPIDMVVGLDHRAAANAMVEAMLVRGKSRILYVGARLDVRTRLRMEGYAQAMEAHGLEPRYVLTEKHSSFTQGRELLDEALVQYPDADGLFCTNDDVAVGALLRCQQRGIAVPAQIAIAGYNALDIGQSVSPALASVETPREVMGIRAAEMLLARLGGNEDAARFNDVGFTVLIGESIG